MQVTATTLILQAPTLVVQSLLNGSMHVVQDVVVTIMNASLPPPPPPPPHTHASVFIIL